MQKLYGIGTILEVAYSHDNIDEECKIILAQTFVDEMLFQVITISGYYAGCVEGYIRYQFDEHDYHRNFCTWGHLENKLNETVFGNLKSVKIITAENTMDDMV